jgi:hypothetical protein
MIELSRLTAADIARFVIYLPSRTKGRIKSWNDKFIFVVYSCDSKWESFERYTAAATRPEDLVWA